MPMAKLNVYGIVRSTLLVLMALLCSACARYDLQEAPELYDLSTIPVPRAGSSDALLEATAQKCSALTCETVTAEYDLALFNDVLRDSGYFSVVESSEEGMVQPSIHIKRAAWSYNINGCTYEDKQALSEEEWQLVCGAWGGRDGLLHSGSFNFPSYSQFRSLV
jgi:hypothetical protein